MNWIVLFVLAVIFALAIFSLKQRRSPAQEDQFPYAKNGLLFSVAERSFLGVLQQAVGEEFAVLGKVRIADVVSVRSMRNRSAWRRAFNRINAKHFDYVVCAKTDYSVACVVELDDSSHQQSKRKERDEFLVNVCRAASLPFLQVPAQRTYAIADIEEKFLEVIGRGASSSLNESVHLPSLQGISETLSAARTIKKNPAAVEEIVKVDLNTKNPLCPKCSATMVMRVIKTGSKAGQQFWGCSTFPKCRGVTLSG